jgi:hypothetical protein
VFSTSANAAVRSARLGTEARPFLAAPPLAGKRLKQVTTAHAAELEPEEDQLRAELARLHAYDQDDDGRDGGADEGPGLDRTG